VARSLLWNVHPPYPSYPFHSRARKPLEPVSIPTLISLFGLLLPSSNPRHWGWSSFPLAPLTSPSFFSLQFTFSQSPLVDLGSYKHIFSDTQNAGSFCASRSFCRGLDICGKCPRPAPPCRTARTQCREHFIGCARPGRLLASWLSVCLWARQLSRWWQL